MAGKVRHLGEFTSDLSRASCAWGDGAFGRSLGRVQLELSQICSYLKGFNEADRFHC